MKFLLNKLLSIFGKIITNVIPGVSLAIDLGISLGAFDWLGKLLVHVLAQRFGLGTDISAKLIKNVASAISKTNDEIESGKLITAEDKQKFASRALKQALKNDPDFANVKNFDSAGALLIELVFQLQKISEQTK